MIYLINRRSVIAFGTVGLALAALAVWLLVAATTPAFAAGPVVVCNLQPDYGAIGGGGVYSAYYGPPSHDPVSPGSTALIDGREGGIIKAGQGADPGPADWDEGLFGFKPTVTINVFAAGTLTYDVEKQAGVNPVWMTIEIDTGVVGDRSDNTSYQFVPTSNPAGWHTVNAGAGLWQKWNNDSGDTTGNPLISLSQVAVDNTGLNVVRTYLRLGMGDTYYNGGTGTTAWVDRTTLGGVTYDFVVSCTPPTPNPNAVGGLVDVVTGGSGSGGLSVIAILAMLVAIAAVTGSGISVLLRRRS
jgi:hypothetical protein